MRAAVIVTGTDTPQAALDRAWEVLGPVARTMSGVQVWLPKYGDLLLPRAVSPRVLTAGEGALPESAQLEWCVRCAAVHRPQLLVCYGNAAGHALAARLAVRLDCPCIPGVQAALPGEAGVALYRSACGSHLRQACLWRGEPTVLTVQEGKAEAPADGLSAEAVVEPIQDLGGGGWPAARTVLEPARANPLETAGQLLIGGRGLGSSGACDRLRAVALRWGMTPGFTRPVAMNGWCGLHEIVGQSGARTSPELCIAVGVSGAAAFLAGIADAKTVIAVNSDEDAPIFRRAHTGFIGDALLFMEQLERP